MTPFASARRNGYLDVEAGPGGAFLHPGGRDITGLLARRA
jgi:hypothetical protein